MSVPRMTNCPNCGAPIESDVCRFCGTKLINIADLKIGDPIWLTFSDESGVQGVRLSLDKISIRHELGDSAFYADAKPVLIGPGKYEIELSGTPCSNNKGVWGYKTDNPEANIFEVIKKGSTDK